MIAATLAYWSSVWAGTEDPTWPHLVLVPLSVLAGVAVGAGIVFESPKYSPAIHRIAFWLVVLGVAVESVCTVSLFVVDERISLAQGAVIKAQQDKILALGGELELAQTHLTDRQVDTDKIVMFSPGQLGVFRGQKLIIEVVPNDDEAARLAENLADVLRGPLAHWDVTVQPLAEPPVPNAIAIRLPIPPGIFGSHAAKQPSVGSKIWGAISALVNMLQAQNFCVSPPLGSAWFADNDPDTLTLLISHKDRTSKSDCL
jgi:hypothetical protein